MQSTFIHKQNYSITKAKDAVELSSFIDTLLLTSFDPIAIFVGLPPCIRIADDSALLLSFSR